ncbi:MAG: hypothetical protein WDM76_00530 [Limisphaerales bacterium]
MPGFTCEPTGTGQRTAGNGCFMPLRAGMFPFYRALFRSPEFGEFSYQRANLISTIRFDAGNLQFQALYNPVYKNGYEQDICSLLDALLPEGGTFYDVGSNWGLLQPVCSQHPPKIGHSCF